MSPVTEVLEGYKVVVVFLFVYNTILRQNKVSLTFKHLFNDERK